MEDSKEMQNEMTENAAMASENNEVVSVDTNETLAENSADSIQTTPEAAEESAVEDVTLSETAKTEEAEAPAASEAEAEAPAAEEAAVPAAEEAEVPAAEETVVSMPEDAVAEEAAEPAYVEPEADYSGMDRQQLVDALAELLTTDDITKIKNRVAAIKVAFTAADKEVQKAAFEKFLEEGGDKNEYTYADDATAVAYHKKYGEYRERRQKHIDELEARKKENLEKKQQILENLRTLIASEEVSLKQAYDQFNALQDQWKAIGEVPRTELNGLWQNYHFLIEQFFGKVRMNKELMLLDQKKNLESKTVLCEKAEELIVETSIAKAAKEAQSLREQWREIGPVPLEHNDEIWARFRNAIAKIDERRREYYDQMREEQDKNLLAKQALVEKVMELTANTPESVKGWNDISAELDEMLKVWKSIGPVPRDKNEEVWAAFKGAIDRFYGEKKAHFASVRDEQSENYNKKIDLCLQAEAIAKRDDWKKATDELLKLQEEWKRIGPVSRKFSEKIWQRFRGACDEFFARKAAHFNELRGSEQENLQKKEAIIAELKSRTFGDNKEENLDALKDFQRRWMEVGYVPISEKQRLQKEFRDTINAIFEQLRITAREAEMSNFRESLRGAKSGGRAISDRREKLVEQIQKLRSDISLWENNLGFLASSKQAELLKEEFDKKMRHARQEIALLEAKIKILDEPVHEESAAAEPAQGEPADVKAEAADGQGDTQDAQ